MPADAATVDVDYLLCAVKARLWSSVGERTAVMRPRQAHDALERGQRIVLECVAALDQLHTTLTLELAKRARLEQEVAAARSGAAWARAEVDSTAADEQQARHCASRDDLTSLPDGAHFRDRLHAALAHRGPGGECKAFAVLYLDLDGFEQINHAHGSDIGDLLLNVVASRLRRAVRIEDLVSRIGGDEFAVLVKVVNREQLCRLAGKLVDAVAAPLKIGQSKFSVRPSIGIAMCPADGSSVEGLLRHAGAAMCRARCLETGHAFYERPTDLAAAHAPAISEPAARPCAASHRT